MVGTVLSRSARTAIQAVFAIAVLLSAQAQAQTQSIVGTWVSADENYTFRSDGRWISTFVSPLCAVTEVASGPYTAAGGSMTMTQDSSLCSGSTLNLLPAPRSLGSGTYTVSGSALVVHLTGGFITPFDLSLAAPAPATITRTTPLSPPPVVQTVFVAPSGQMPAAAVVDVTPVGTFGNASLTVTLDISRVLPAAFAASTYNVYVIAVVPGAVLGSASPVIAIKTRLGGWGLLRFPVPAYLENVAQGAVNNQVLIEILSNNDMTSLVGTEIYIGYGQSDQEMLLSGRYRGVYKVQ